MSDNYKSLEAIADELAYEFLNEAWNRRADVLSVNAITPKFLTVTSADRALDRLVDLQVKRYEASQNAPRP